MYVTKKHMSNVDNQKHKNNLPLTSLFVFTIHNPKTTIIMGKNSWFIVLKFKSQKICKIQ